MAGRFLPTVRDLAVAQRSPYGFLSLVSDFPSLRPMVRAFVAAPDAGRGAPSVSEEYARVPEPVRHRGGLSGLLGGVSLAGGVRVPALRAFAWLSPEEIESTAMCGVSAP